LRLGRGVPLGVLLRAEVRPVEDLLQARDLGPLGGGLADQLDVLVDRVLLGHVRLGLDDGGADGAHVVTSSIVAGCCRNAGMMSFPKMRICSAGSSPML